MSKIEPRDMVANSDILIESAVELVAAEVGQSRQVDLDALMK